MIVIIDNYDSFTYNLVQYLGELGESLDVRRNDAVAVALEPDQPVPRNGVSGKPIILPAVGQLVIVTSLIVIS